MKDRDQASGSIGGPKPYLNPYVAGALLGLVLGFAWTAIVGMAYRARAVRPFNGTVASGVFYGTLALSFAWQVAVHTAQDLETLQIPLPERTMAAETWWQAKTALDALPITWDEGPNAEVTSASIAETASSTLPCSALLVSMISGTRVSPSAGACSSSSGSSSRGRWTGFVSPTRTTGSGHSRGAPRRWSISAATGWPTRAS